MFAFTEMLPETNVEPKSRAILVDDVVTEVATPPEVTPAGKVHV